jgi:hypothetical protein
MTEPAAYARVIEDRPFSHQQPVSARAIPILILFSNTAWLHLCGYANSQNNDGPLHYVTVGVLCAMNAIRIIQSTFRSHTTN